MRERAGIDVKHDGPTVVITMRVNGKRATMRVTREYAASLADELLPPHERIKRIFGGLEGFSRGPVG